ncbi:hypothetical protein RJT34_32057 [Clitoria ternatea]|uniref:Uncharacterized protein n=1 Tax=Clitoria ternatea TaxID=43366 RepID=A0AAN9EX01_CLITE
MRGESNEETRKAELWVTIALSYSLSPFMPKIKIVRSITVDIVCDFNEEKGKMQKVLANVDNNVLETDVQPQYMNTKEHEVDKIKKTSANVDDKVLEKVTTSTNQKKPTNKNDFLMDVLNLFPQENALSVKLLANGK